MSLIHWMPENNTNIDFVDNQHRNIASLINELERSLESNPNNAETQRIIKKGSSPKRVPISMKIIEP